MKIVLRLRSWRAMAVSTHRHLLGGIVFAADVFFLALLRGKPQIRLFRIGRWRHSMSLSLLGALFWSSGRMEVARSGAVYFFIVDNTDSRRHGTVESRCRMYVVGLAQGGGAVWHRGDVDGRPGKVIASITQEDGSVEDGGSRASACVALRLLDRFVWFR